MTEHWVSTAEAFDLLTIRYDLSGRYADLEVCRAVAEDALLRRLSSGALRARAAKGHLRCGDPTGVEKESDLANAVIPAMFWSSLKGSEDADREIDWVLGDFSFSTGYNEFCASGAAFGVIFEVAGMPGADALLGSGGGPQTATNEGGKGRPAKYPWVEAALAIFGLIHRGDFKPTSQAEIEKALIEHLAVGDSAPGESTVRPYAKLLWDEYHKA